MDTVECPKGEIRKTRYSWILWAVIKRRDRTPSVHSVTFATIAKIGTKYQRHIVSDPEGAPREQVEVLLHLEVKCMTPILEE